MSTHPPEKLLTPKEVAAYFAVNPKTVTRWSRSGKLPTIRTMGGHRRFRWSVVEALTQEHLEGQPGQAQVR